MEMKNKKEEICENCGESDYNHLNKDGVRSSRTGIFCPDGSGKNFKPVHSPQGNTTKGGSISSPEDTSKEEFCLSDARKRLFERITGTNISFSLKDLFEEIVYQDKKAVKLLKEELGNPQFFSPAQYMIIKEFIDKIFGKDLI